MLLPLADFDWANNAFQVVLTILGGAAIPWAWKMLGKVDEAVEQSGRAAESVERIEDQLTESNRMNREEHTEFYRRHSETEKGLAEIRGRLGRHGEKRDP